jgi:uncharacterized protein (DUF1501 family)
MAQTRREFLVHTGCGALSASALLSGLGRFALIDALAQSPSDYKALVCVFLFGGNDSNNMVIPVTNYADYDAARQRDDQSQTRTYAEFQIPVADLLTINPPSNGLTFGLNPRLGDQFSMGGVTNPSIYDLWNAGNAAVVCNVGPLIRPLSRAEYIQNLSRPYQLFSHSDQQNLWQTSWANGPKQTGWGGSTVDKTPSAGGNFPVVASIAGVTVFSTGLNTRPLVLSPAPTALNASLRLFKPGAAQSEDEIRHILMTDEDQLMPALIQGAATITQKALDASDLLQTDPTISTPFPNTSLGNQLKQVAKLIKIAPSLSLTRQVFFVSIGGFDTHTGQGRYNPLPGPITTGGQLGLLQQLSQAVGSFYAAITNPQDFSPPANVTLFTSSDFSRTLLPGGGNTGTDHAWGSHQFVVGPAVNGGDFYGQFQSLATGADQDTDGGGNPRGRWIPTSSVDQYALTLASWYGLAQSDWASVFPNIGHFNSPTLGFMNAGAAPSRATAAARARKG